MDMAIPHAWHEDLDVSGRKVAEGFDKVFDEADMLDLCARNHYASVLGGSSTSRD
jgi:hypothetical protein